VETWAWGQGAGVCAQPGSAKPAGVLSCALPLPPTLARPWAGVKEMNSLGFPPYLWRVGGPKAREWGLWPCSIFFSPSGMWASFMGSTSQAGEGGWTVPPGLAKNWAVVLFCRCAGILQCLS